MADELNVKVEGVEIRGFMEKESKQGRKFLVVRFEDEAGVSHQILDYDVENKAVYKKGTMADLYAVIKSGVTNGAPWWRMSVTSVKKIDSEK